jgi:hypothetical protein
MMALAVGCAVEVADIVVETEHRAIALQVERERVVVVAVVVSE